MIQQQSNGDSQNFAEARLDWEVERLVKDLEGFEKRLLTSAEKRNLQAMLLGLSGSQAQERMGVDKRNRGLDGYFTKIRRMVESFLGLESNALRTSYDFVNALGSYRKDQESKQEFELLGHDRLSIPIKNENIAPNTISTSFDLLRRECDLILTEPENIDPPTNIDEPKYLEDTADSFIRNNSNSTNPQSIIQQEINRKLDLYANVAREKLYGVDIYLSKLEEYLNNKEDWLIGVVGQGGVGKTSVVEKLVREHGAKLGFTEFAWVTAKRTFLRIEDLSKENISNSSINLASVITSIANQLQITLPTDPNIDNLLGYLWIQLKLGSYLIVIDNLETLDEGEQLLQGFNPYGYLPSSKIILTSRGRLQQNNNRIREVILKGIDLQSTLALIRYKGDHVDRVVTATDEELLPIREISEGIPLIILLVVNLIATNTQLSLEQIIDRIKNEKNFFSYLYEKSLESISNEALNILYAMSEMSSNSSIYHDNLKDLSNLNDNDFNNSVSELIRSSLLNNVSRLTDQPRYSIHSLLYEFLKLNC